VENVDGGRGKRKAPAVCTCRTVVRYFESKRRIRMYIYIGRTPTRENQKRSLVRLLLPRSGYIYIYYLRTIARVRLITRYGRRIRRRHIVRAALADRKGLYAPWNRAKRPSKLQHFACIYAGNSDLSTN